MNFLRKPHTPSQDVTASILYDEKTFYNSDQVKSQPLNKETFQTFFEGTYAI